VSRLSFEVWVDEHGHAEKCKVLALESEMPLSAGALASRICTTQLHAAVRRGAEVASIRRIELMLAP
jgi:hypothetical protein